MATDRIAKEWASFVETVLPKDCSELQRTEMRKAFYAGNLSMMRTIVGGVSPGPDVEQRDLNMMDELHAELMEFYSASLQEIFRGNENG